MKKTCARVLRLSGRGRGCNGTGGRESSRVMSPSEKIMYTGLTSINVRISQVLFDKCPPVAIELRVYKFAVQRNYVISSSLW